MSDLHNLARALGGEVSGAQVLAPGPGHSQRDRSLSVRLSAVAPDGFIAFSHAGDGWRECRDYVRDRLGLIDYRKRPAAVTEPPSNDNANRTAGALALWAESIDPRGTLAEVYLSSRSLELGDDLAGEVLRWHARSGAMIALFRNIVTDKPQAISRTYLDREGRKISRKFLGPVRGCAVKLDPDEGVLNGLHLGEGIETVMASRQIGLRPAWALGSAGAIASFPVLAGVEFPSLLREHDEANRRAADACALRWTEAEREVLDVWPRFGKDVNDTIRGQL